MALLSNVIQRGTRGSQPAANSVPTGTLYFVTDEAVTERSSGSAWQTYGGSGLFDTVFVRKSADESLNTSATLQADDALLFAVGASETWIFEFHVVYLGNTTGDFRCGLKFPTTPTEISYYIDGIIATGANDALAGFAGDRGLTHATADAVGGAILGADTNKSVARLTGFVRNSTNAGNVVLWWAQGTSNGTDTTVKAGSWVYARRVA